MFFEFWNQNENRNGIFDFKTEPKKSKTIYSDFEPELIGTAKIHFSFIPENVRDMCRKLEEELGSSLDVEEEKPEPAMVPLTAYLQRRADLMKEG